MSKADVDIREQRLMYMIRVLDKQQLRYSNNPRSGIMLVP